MTCNDMYEYSFFLEIQTEMKMRVIASRPPPAPQQGVTVDVDLPGIRTWYSSLLKIETELKL